jgi:hypothetical protein
MSKPGPPGEDERGPDTGMGLPESGTQHATSTDFAVPLVDRDSGSDPLSAGTPPPAQPRPPAYDDPSELVDPAPAHDEPTEVLDAVQDVESTELATPTPAYDALAAESGFQPSASRTAGGALAKVKAFADERPAAFLAAALIAGWLVGKLLSSSDDEDEG